MSICTIRVQTGHTMRSSHSHVLALRTNDCRDGCTDSAIHALWHFSSIRQYTASTHSCNPLGLTFHDASSVCNGCLLVLRCVRTPTRGESTCIESLVVPLVISDWGSLVQYEPLLPSLCPLESPQQVL